MRFDFYFDLASPYAYLGVMRLPAMVLPAGCAVAYRPVDVEAIKRAAGNIGPALRDLPAKKRYVLQDAARWARRFGFAFTEPAGWDAARLNRGTFLAIDRGVAAAYVGAAAHQVWGLGGDPASEPLMAAVAQAMGWDAQELFSYTLSPAALQRERETLAAGRAAGVFGVPTCVVEGQLWWGNDRLSSVQEALRHG